jgi:hypothetical protein
MDGIKTAKDLVGVVVGSGVSLIIAGIVKNNVHSEKPIEKALIFAGRTGLSMMVSDAVKAHTDTKIDAAISWWQEASKIISEQANKEA